MDAATIEVRKAKGMVIVYVTGRTGRGQRFIKASKALGVSGIGDKNFKAEMTQAVVEMLGKTA